MSAAVSTCQQLSVHVSSCQYMTAAVSTCQQLSVHDSSCQYMSAAVSSCQLPPVSPGTDCVGGWVGLRASLDGCGKSRPPRNSIPDLQARSQSLYQLSYPVPHYLFQNNFSSAWAWLIHFTSPKVISLILFTGVVFVWVTHWMYVFVTWYLI
jgi:hypothetical protein